MARNSAELTLEKTIKLLVKYSMRYALRDEGSGMFLFVGELADDEVLCPLLRKEFLKQLKNCESETRQIEGKELLGLVDPEMSRRVTRRGAMQLFAWNLVCRKPMIAKDLDDAVDTLKQEGFSIEEIEERKVRFREWADGK